MESIFVFDLETTGLDPRKDKIIGCGYTTDGVDIKFDRSYTDPMDIALQASLATEVVAHNAKFDLGFIGAHTLETVFDTMVAEWVLYPDQKKLNLKWLGEKYFGEKNPGYKELLNQYKPKGTKIKDATLDMIPNDIADKYAKKDVELTHRLYKIQKEELKKRGLEELFYGLEMPFIAVLAEMELNGIKLDTKKIEKLRVSAEEKLIKIEADITTMVGEKKVNINSPKQLATYLYDTLKLPRLSENTAYATGENILKRISDKHPIVPLILEHRKTAKLLRTYLSALPSYVSEDGRIHPNFKQVGTGTGRLSCDNPNLQNIPKGESEGGEIREAFVPEDGHVFIIGDYDQMELRMLAHISKDKALIEAFTSGVDIHKLTAQKIFNKAEISDEERRSAKTINFGIIYGQSVNGLAKALDISPKEATKFMYSYACAYPSAWMWRKMQMWGVQKTPIVETIIGRKRDLNAVSGVADRMSLNTPIQGSCADLVKIAMIRCYKALKKAGLKTKIVLQIHDELIFEAPESEKEQALDIIKGCMESINCLNDVVLDCPMKVCIDYAKTWKEKAK